MSKSSRALIFLFAAGDLILLNASIAASFRLGNPDGDAESAVYLYIFSNLVWLFLMLVIHPYRPTVSGVAGIIIKSQFSFLFTHALMVLSLVMFSDKVFAPLQLIFLYGIFVPLTFIWRWLYHAIQRRMIAGVETIGYILVGEGELAEDIRKNLESRPAQRFQLSAQFTEKEILEEAVQFAALQEKCLKDGVKEIYCCLPTIRQLDLRKLIDFGLNHFVSVILVQDASSFYQKGIQLEPVLSVPVVNIAAVPLDDMTNRFIKRSFDLVFAGLVTIFILSWLFPLLSVVIMVDSRGPAVYRQRRAGKGNKPFDCLKFRTMTWEGQATFVQATQQDPRVTRVGKFLRKTSLDEFPQFINVLMGDMSVVGPRPHPLKLNDDYLPRIRKLMSRHYVKPGVTGLAQCMGYRGGTINFRDMKNRITLDRFYVENWSLAFDIRIIFQTVHSLLKNSDKAY